MSIALSKNEIQIVVPSRFLAVIAVKYEDTAVPKSLNAISIAACITFPASTVLCLFRLAVTQVDYVELTERRDLFCYFGVFVVAQSCFVVNARKF